MEPKRPADRKYGVGRGGKRTSECGSTWLQCRVTPEESVGWLDWGVP